MAINLIVENGQGLEDANSYVTIQEVSDAAEMAGIDSWCENTSKHEIAVIQASKFFDLRYSGRFCGQIFNEDQGLLFPRKIFDTTTGIPKQLKQAVIELALMYIENDGLDLNANSNMSVESESVSVGNGAVTETVKYFKESSKVAYSNFAASDRYVNQLLQNVGCESRNNSMFIQAYKG